MHLFFPGELRFQSVSLLRCQPTGLARAVGQAEQYVDTEQDRWYPPNDIDPLPALEPQDQWVTDRFPVDNDRPSDVDDPLRDPRADNHRHGRGYQKIRNRSSTVFLSKPMAQVDDHAGEKSSFGNAQEKSHQIELHRSGDKGRHRSHDPPSDHDAANPLASTPALDDQRARYLQQKVSEKKDPPAESEDGRIERWHILFHRQLGNRNIVAIDVSDDVADKKNRNQTQIRLEPRGIQGHGMLGIFVILSGDFVWIVS